MARLMKIYWYDLFTLIHIYSDNLQRYTCL